MPDSEFLAAPEWRAGIQIDVPGLEHEPAVVHAVLAPRDAGIVPTACHQRVELPDEAGSWPPSKGDLCPRCVTEVDRISRRRW